MLTTKSGKYCNQNDINCWNKMNQLKGVVKLNLVNGLDSTQKEFNGISVV